jgi:hypothetical protein
MRYLAAMIYASNDKRGGFTGYYKNIAEKEAFNTEDFVKYAALAGPHSQVHCLVKK